MQRRILRSTVSHVEGGYKHNWLVDVVFMLVFSTVFQAMLKYVSAAVHLSNGAPEGLQQGYIMLMMCAAEDSTPVSLLDCTAYPVKCVLLATSSSSLQLGGKYLHTHQTA